jgi:hypothetical protein
MWAVAPKGGGEIEGTGQMLVRRYYPRIFLKGLGIILILGSRWVGQDLNWSPAE